MNRPNRAASSGIGVFVLVLVSLQVFLLTIGTEALLAFDPRQAWTAAVLSSILAASSMSLYIFFRRR
jgi:hypothetical protein